MDIQHYTQPNPRASMHAINLAGLCRDFKKNEIGIEVFSISILGMLNDMHETLCEYAKTQTDQTEKIEELEEEISDLETKIEDLEGVISDYEDEDRTEDLEDQISDLEQEISDFEEKIAKIKEIAENAQMSGNAKGKKILEIINN